VRLFRWQGALRQWSQPAVCEPRDRPERLRSVRYAVLWRHALHELGVRMPRRLSRLRRHVRSGYFDVHELVRDDVCSLPRAGQRQGYLQRSPAPLRSELPRNAAEAMRCRQRGVLRDRRAHLRPGGRSMRLASDGVERHTVFGVEPVRPELYVPGRRLHGEQSRCVPERCVQQGGDVPAGHGDVLARDAADRRDAVHGRCGRDDV
jgi:hypothetical protein